jgi:hypothetical protein
VGRSLGEAAIVLQARMCGECRLRRCGERRLQWPLGAENVVFSGLGEGEGLALSCGK